MTTIRYAATKPYSGNRPWADLTLDPGGKAVTLKCLVDTGADYVQINAADATAAGISLSGATAHPVTTVAGTTTLQLVRGVQVTIEGSKVLTIDILVDMTNSTNHRWPADRLYSQPSISDLTSPSGSVHDQ